MIKVVAKPKIGPEPNVANTIAVNNVVKLPSMIELMARLKPSLTAIFNPLPSLSSSRIRSNINTLASTAIPIVNTIPAIPGNVKDA